MKLESILNTGEKLIATHHQIQTAIRDASTELSTLDRQLNEAEQRASTAEAGAALGESAMVDSTRKTLTSIRDRHVSVSLRLEGLRNRLVSIEHSTELRCTAEALAGSDELKRIASCAAVEAQAEIDQAAGTLMQALSHGRAIELATGVTFVQLPAVPTVTIDPVQAQHASKESLPRIMATATRAAVATIPPAPADSLPDLIARSSRLKNDLIRAVGEIEGARRTEQRQRHRARVAAAGHGLVPRNGLSIPRTPENRAPQPWHPSGGMVS